MAVHSSSIPASASADPDRRRIFLRQRAADLMAEAGRETRSNRRVALIELAFIWWRLAREYEERGLR